MTAGRSDPFTHVPLAVVSWCRCALAGMCIVTPGTNRASCTLEMATRAG